MEINKDTFYQFLDEKINNIENIVWLSSIIFHKLYKDKYIFVCYIKDTWIHKIDNTMTSIQVKNCILNDIKNLINELSLYNKTRKNECINIIINKLNDKIFIKGVINELRELFFNPS